MHGENVVQGKNGVTFPETNVNHNVASSFQYVANHDPLNRKIASLSGSTNAISVMFRIPPRNFDTKTLVLTATKFGEAGMIAIQ